MISKRMRRVLPLFVMNAISLAIYSGCFVNIIASTLKNQHYDENQELSVSLFAMIPLGVGGLLGSAIVGFIIDKFGSKKTIIVYFFTLTLGYMLVLGQIALNEFTPLVYFMTLAWGV